MRSRFWPIMCLLLLALSSAVMAQCSAPLPSLTPGQSPPPTPALSPTLTPIAVLLVTPETTPAPPSPWPPAAEKAAAWLRALWQAFGWWVIPIVLLAGLFILARMVGAELLGRWSKGIAAWLDDLLKNLAAKLQRGPDPAQNVLLQDIVKNYEYLEMKGFVGDKVITASLESIYVPLFTRGVDGGGRIPRGGELGGLLARAEAGEPTPLSALLPRHRCLVVVGEAGAGKTTFLRHVALTLARALRDRQPALVRQRLDWQPDRLPLPVFLPLSGFGLYLKKLDDAQKESPNCDLLLDYMRHHWRDLHLPEDFFEVQLKRAGGCLVLLDGLDEVAYFEDRVFISQTITLFARRYEGARFIVTCRPEGYRGGAQLGGDFQRADIEPLRWPDDIAPFVRGWNEAVLKTGSRTAEDNTQDFLRRLEGQERVRALADNPLLLTVMIIVHFNVGRLPERRADLYNSATLLLLGWDTRWRRLGAAPPPWLDDIEAEGKRLYLEELAYHWQTQGVLEMRREKAEELLTPSFLTGRGEEMEREAAGRATIFLDWVVERSYLLRPLGNVLSFYRRAFQEYLAARCLAQESKPADVVLRVLEQNWDWWEETVVLTISHLSTWYRAKAAEVLQALLDAPDDSQASHRHLVLAGRALADAAREHLPWQLVEEVKVRLADAVTRTDAAFAVPLRVHAGQALAALGDRRPGVCDAFPLLVQVPGGPFRMGSPPEEVERWKAWYRQGIEEGRYTPAEGWTREQLFEAYAAWLDAEAGPHIIEAPTFYMAHCPVTNAQFAPFVDKRTGGYDDSTLWSEAGWAWRQGQGAGWGRPPERREEPMFWRDTRFNAPNQPLVGVTWFEAMAYARWLTRQLPAADCRLQVWRNGKVEPLGLPVSTLKLRLPTEAEWEKAARGGLSSPASGEGAGGGGRIWPWGDKWDATKANTSEGRGEWTTTPVGLYPDGASPYGVLDLAGNVWEWTSTRWGDDWRRPDYDPPYRADDGREDAEGEALRVIRGGSWADDRVPARCASRYGDFPPTSVGCGWWCPPFVLIPELLAAGF